MNEQRRADGLKREVIADTGGIDGPIDAAFELIDLPAAAAYIASGDRDQRNWFPGYGHVEGPRDWRRIVAGDDLEGRERDRQRQDFEARYNLAVNLIAEAIASGRLHVITISMIGDQVDSPDRTIVSAIDPSEFASGMSLGPCGGIYELRLGCTPETLASGQFGRVPDPHFLWSEIEQMRRPDLVAPWIKPPPSDGTAELAVLRSVLGALHADESTPIGAGPAPRRAGRRPGRIWALPISRFRSRLEAMGRDDGEILTNAVLGAMFVEECVKLGQAAPHDDTAEAEARAVRDELYGA